MPSNRSELHQNLFEAYKKAHPDVLKQLAQKKSNELWTSLKEKYKDDKEFGKEINLVINELLKKATEKKAGILNFFVKAASSKKKNQGELENNVPAVPTSLPSTSHAESNVVAVSPPEKEQDNNSAQDVDREKPSQAMSKKHISDLETQITSLMIAIDSGLADDINIRSKLEKLRLELAREKQCLKRKISDADRQRKQREKKKNKLEEIFEKNPELKKELSVRQTVGRPRLETDQSALLEAISDIAIFGGAADDKRRSDIIRSCRTLDQLLHELQKSGFSISRSGLYLRLLPRNVSTIEGKRHVNALPVKLSRAQNDQHANHPDAAFCTSTIRSLESIASILGPQEVCFLSQDDKCRVPIGITAAKAQAPLLMHLEYKVRLPDHDWVVANKHKLIPSVYAGILIEPNGNGKPEAVSYSGPTYIGIRSGKHDSTSAETHAIDLETLTGLESFRPVMKTQNGLIKPVMMITVDGGPDENPRYPRVIASAIGHFKKYDLDAIYIATNAPGRSAFNRVERRMAPLSKELSGVILPHDHFGSHLDTQNRTVDDALERKNFARAGEILAEIWGSMVIDGYAVTAEYVHPEKSEASAPFENIQWYSRHVRGSQYFLQIAKCDRQDCCGIRRSSLWMILKDGFVPPPYPIVQRPNTGLLVPDNGNSVEIANKEKFAPLLLRLAVKIQPSFEDFTVLPYDYFCPSVKSQLTVRCCKHCGLYHASIKLAKLHMKEMHAKKGKATIIQQFPKIRPLRVAAKRARELMVIMGDSIGGATDLEWLDESDVETEGLEIPSTDQSKTSINIEVISSISEWIASPWRRENE